MATRNSSLTRSAFVSIDPLRVDALKLKKAKRILGADSDVDTLNKALARIITNDEMETAIEKAFGSVPYSQLR